MKACVGVNSIYKCSQTLIVSLPNSVPSSERELYARQQQYTLRTSIQKN